MLLKVRQPYKRTALAWTLVMGEAVRVWVGGTRKLFGLYFPLAFVANLKLL